MAQRELKFRIWDNEAKKLMTRDEIEALRLNPSFNKGVTWLDMSDCYGGPTGPLTWLQFTGLKDKNGKDIYEGDVVKWGHIRGGEENPIRIGETRIDPDIQFVVKHPRYADGEHVFDYGSFAYADTENWLEVIGNIHENPELLSK